MELTSITEYQDRRIHTSRLESGTWVASIVAPGGIVQHVPGEFVSHEQAVEAAQRHIGQNTENGK
jgi:hypothetical protein